MNISSDMLKTLRTSLKSLKEAQKIQDNLVNELVEYLPENKKKEAVALINKARKGKVDASEMMNFAKGVRDINKEEFEKNVKDAISNIDKKKKEVKKSSAKKKPAKQ